MAKPVNNDVVLFIALLWVIKKLYLNYKSMQQNIFKNAKFFIKPELIWIFGRKNRFLSLF
jgi:hypothetical protein